MRSKIKKSVIFLIIERRFKFDTIRKWKVKIKSYKVSVKVNITFIV